MRFHSLFLSKSNVLKAFCGYFLLFSSPSFAISISLASLPSSLVRLGENPTDYALIVEKLTHKLNVYKPNEFGDYELVKSYPAITGKKQGDKQIQGDKKTPEGIYFITGKIHGKNLIPKYGPGALVLDYPNIFDQRLSKTGSGIWIHGVENDTRVFKPFDTEGCVALRNSDWLDLEKYVTPLETPVVITKEVSTMESKEGIEKQRKSVLDSLYSWKNAWQNSDLHSYGNFYSNKFSADGKNKHQWLETKKKLGIISRSDIVIDIYNPKILSFENQMLVSFFQKYHSTAKEDSGIKFLYFQKEDDGFKIISEKWYPREPNSKKMLIGQEIHSAKWKSFEQK